MSPLRLARSRPSAPRPRGSARARAAGRGRTVQRSPPGRADGAVVDDDDLVDRHRRQTREQRRQQLLAVVVEDDRRHRETARSVVRQRLHGHSQCRSRSGRRVCQDPRDEARALVRLRCSITGSPGCRRRRIRTGSSFDRSTSDDSSGAFARGGTSSSTSASGPGGSGRRRHAGYVDTHLRRRVRRQPRDARPDPRRGERHGDGVRRLGLARAADALPHRERAS